MEEISFRMATEKDREFVRELSAGVFSIFGDYDEILSQWFPQPGVFTVIGSKKGSPVGFAMLQLGEGGGGDASTGELLAIAVAPEDQGQGVGKTLLSQVEELARQYRVREIHLHTAKDNLFARFLFERAGYEVLGSKKRYYPQGQAAVMMGKMLGS